MDHPCLWILAALLACGACSAQTRSVAITVDDLPLPDGGSAADAERVNHAILHALARFHAPATGFVVEKWLQSVGAEPGKAILREWLDAGQDLGNHTFSHADLNALTVDQFRTEVIDGEPALRAVLGERGRTPRYFRFPYLSTGNTEEKHDAVAAFLAGRGYSNATCTISNSDWEFTRAYEAALARHDRQAASKLRADYLAHTAAVIDYETAVNLKVFGRDVPHVMLLHANRLNADAFADVLRVFETKGYRFVTLDQAQSDAAYKTPDTFASGTGGLWGHRWARQRGIAVGDIEAPQLPAWVLQYGK